jgi:hypothetical protein
MEAWRSMRARYLALAKQLPAALRVAARCAVASFALRAASAPSWPARQRAPSTPNRCIRSTWFTPFDSSMRDSLCRSSYMPILRPPSGGCPHLFMSASDSDAALCSRWPWACAMHTFGQFASRARLALHATEFAAALRRRLPYFLASSGLTTLGSPTSTLPLRFNSECMTASPTDSSIRLEMRPATYFWPPL